MPKTYFGPGLVTRTDGRTLRRVLAHGRQVGRPLPRRRPGRHDRPLITTTSSAHHTPAPVVRKIVHLRRNAGGGPYRSPTSSAWPPPPSKPCSPTWTGSPAKRYAQHRAPGEMLHVDVKKLGNVPDRGGWRYFGRSQGEKNRVATAGKPRNPMIGIAFVHTVTDDHSEWPTPRSTTTKPLSLPPAYCAACRPVRPARVHHHPPGCCPTTAWPQIAFLARHPHPTRRHGQEDPHLPATGMGHWGGLGGSDWSRRPRARHPDQDDEYRAVMVSDHRVLMIISIACVHGERDR